jgi:hypothetical protein
LPVEGNAAQSGEEPIAEGISEKLVFGDVIKRSGRGQSQQWDVFPALVFDQQNKGTVCGQIMYAVSFEAKKRPKQESGQKLENPEKTFLASWRVLPVGFLPQRRFVHSN